eukprot:6183135-Pleurochrysis_carterae.AAC.3
MNKGLNKSSCASTKHTPLLPMSGTCTSTPERAPTSLSDKQSKLRRACATLTRRQVDNICPKRDKVPDPQRKKSLQDTTQQLARMLDACDEAT